MTALPADARARLPREPYPGLRPFLDFEAALLFGRERQVREVIAHLKLTQFVAVLGGSGSGKSSLIHAGVVPELRSFGIPGAGDLWLPITCTPGTNVSSEDSAARRHSPVTRLARRFAGLLKPRATPEADAHRIEEIAACFRQDAGFARLIDAYGGELAVPPGPDPAEARVLFVLDQFEEVFHPTNKGVADANLLVERVLDHFFNPHPRCHVILTMRSEHLNDCATYLELPDAINKSSYLIRRLDDSELTEAITGPAQRFLRLVARSESSAPVARPLPKEVRFAPAVLARLLRDVKAITHDPDHLPLLQHLLARLWEAALEREEMDVPVPSEITEADLLRAVSAGAAGSSEVPPLDERTNTLRACVENWPESIYRWHDANGQGQLDALFRHLAFKDPNTGLYSQQRIDVNAGARLLGEGKTRADLRALLAEGYLGSVDYLFWDEEDPSRVTLKVSHESFIRGWGRFRRLIDKESEDFEEFLAVLRRCEDWTASQRGEDFLLETGELRRLRESRFEARLAAPAQRECWFRWLRLDRDGTRLLRQQEHLDTFLATSSQRLRDRERRLAQQRLGWWLLAATLVATMAVSTLFSFFVQAPVTQRAELLFDASNRANRTPLEVAYAGAGSAEGPLESLLAAVERVEAARTGQGSLPARVSAWALSSLAWIPQVQRQQSFLANIAASSEPPINGKLRQLLGSAVWRAFPPGAAEQAIPMPEVRAATCSPGEGVNDAITALPGRLYVAAGRTRERALFVPDVLPGDTVLVLRSASTDRAGGACRFGPAVISISLFLDPSVVLDAGLRYYYFVTAGSNVLTPAVTVQEINWEDAETALARRLQSQVRSVMVGPQAVARVRRAAGPLRVGVAPTWRTAGGRVVAVDGQFWRLFSPAAQPLPVAADDPRFVRLAASAAGSPCALLADGNADAVAFRTTVFETAEHCVVVQRGNPGASAAGDAPPEREQVLVGVYQRPTADALRRLADNPPAAIASLTPFVRTATSDVEWMVGVRGDYAGWLALRIRGDDGAQRLAGAPWSACALWRMGRAMRLPAAAADPPALPRDPGMCRDR